jgi:murein DD-endopeptidase MepM/ murein hydrolase activator NlpD
MKMSEIKFDHLPHEICRVTSPFGYRINPITRARQSYHQGIDIGAIKSGIEGDKLFAVADGKVMHADYMSSKVYGYGYFIIIQNKGFCTLYAHMKGLSVNVNQEVKAGQVVGYMGSTGASTAAHLHFEVQPIEFKSYAHYITSENGIRKYAVDPYPFIEDYRNRQEVEKIVAEIKRYKNINEMPEFYQGFIKKWVDKGYIKGNSDGTLDFTEDMIRVLIISERMMNK